MKSQLTSMMFLNSSAEPFDPYRFYGKSPDPGLSKQFYQDNSLQKAALSKLDIFKKISQLEAKEKNLEIQTLKTAKLTKARIFQEKVEEIIQSATNVHNRSILLLHENATKIQKHVKGFLTRKRFEDDFIDFKEKQLSFFVNSLEILSEKSFFTLGTNTLPVFII
jgi:hypothetical protein